MKYDIYNESLLKWLASAKEYIYPVDKTKQMMFYGTGDNVWGIQTNKKALAAFAVASQYDCFDENMANMTKLEAREYALAFFRYSMETHVEGNMNLTDGSRWGHSWISSLGFERIMHAADLLFPDLIEAEKALFKKIQISECDWLVDNYQIEAERNNHVNKTGFIADYGKTNNKNRPESNIWNGAVLFRTAMMYPDVQRVQEYIDRGTKFFVNGISVESDRDSKDVYNGKTIAEMFVGDNFFESFALDHHGYLNIGYMAICLSNISMIHYAYKMRGLTAPGIIYRHVEELWRFVKTCTFEDGTLIRIGGDARTRYCYCQDYLLPVLIFAKDVLHDAEAAEMEEKWVQKVVSEQNLSGDGSYLKERCNALKKVSPLYYTRLESDRALTFSIGYVWNRFINESGGNLAEPQKSGYIDKWIEPHHGSCLSRTRNRLASWCWRGAEGPTGLCVSPDRSDMAEYKHNMFAQILSNSQVDELIQEGEHHEKLIDNGFLTFGEGKTYALKFYAEAESDKLVAKQKVAIAALPDDSTMIVMQHAKVVNRCFLKSVKGAFLLVQNDIFNGKSRQVSYEDARDSFRAMQGEDQLFRLNSNWVNFDDKLGICLGYGGDGIEVYRPGRRQIGITGRNLGDEMLYAEEVCINAKIEPFWAEKNEVIVDVGFAIKIGVDAEKTKESAQSIFLSIVSCADYAVRWVNIIGEDGRDYLVIANFGSESAIITPMKGVDIVPFERLIRKAQSVDDLIIPPEDVVIFEIVH